MIYIYGINSYILEHKVPIHTSPTNTIVAYLKTLSKTLFDRVRLSSILASHILSYTD